MKPIIKISLIKFLLQKNIYLKTTLSILINQKNEKF